MIGVELAAAGGFRRGVTGTWQWQLGASEVWTIIHYGNERTKDGVKQSKLPVHPVVSRDEALQWEACRLVATRRRARPLGFRGAYACRDNRH